MCIAVCVQQGSNIRCAGGKISDAVVVHVPREKVQRRIFPADVLEETAAEIHLIRQRGTADQKMGESCLDGFGGDHIKTEVIFGRTLPHIVLIQIGLVPDLPMPDVPMKAVCPAFVVVADDLDADARPLIHVRRHIGVEEAVTGALTDNVSCDLVSTATIPSMATNINNRYIKFSDFKTTNFFISVMKELLRFASNRQDP